MNILYISKYATPLKYRFGSRHFYLASEFNKIGNNTVVISSDSNHLAQFPSFTSIYTHEIVDGVDTWWIKTVKYRGSKSIRRILSWIDFESKLLLMPKSELPRPDVIIVSSLSLLTVLTGYLLKRKFSCKLAFEIRDIWPLTIIEEGGFSPRNPLVMGLAWVEKFGYAHSDIIVGTMPNLAEHVEEVTGRKSCCHYIPFGYDPDLLEKHEPLPEEYEETYIPSDKFIIGYAGSIGITNALDTFINCASRMKDEPGIHFLLLGDGDLLGQYKSKTAGLTNITFAPKVRKGQVQSVLRHCHVLYLSALASKVWRYGLSLNKVIDYMIAGKPIIASYSGYPSMINEAQCGVFVPAEDMAALRHAIYEYQKMPKEQLQAIGARGREWLLNNRSYGKLAQDYLEVLK